MSSLSTKDSFDKPEKASTLIWVGTFLAGIGFLLATFFLPFLNSIFGVDITIGFTTVLLGLFAFLIANPKSRNRLGMAFQGFYRAITSFAIKKNPLKALDAYVKKMRKDLREIAGQLGTLRGQMRRLSQQIESNETSLSTVMEEASKAKHSAIKNKMIIKARKASRLKASTDRLRELYRKMEILDKILTRIYTHTEILHEDVRDQIEVKKIEFKTMTASAKAMRSAQNIIGKNQKRRLFNQAVEAIADDVSQKVGEIGRFLDRSSSFMDQIDFQSGYFEEEGLKMLEDLEKESEALLLDSPDKPSLDLDRSGENALDLEEKLKEKEERFNPYNDLFE